MKWGLLPVSFLLSLAISTANAAVQIGQNFTASTFGPDSTALPSDTTGAIGPSHFVELINGRFNVYDRNTGKRLQSMTDDTFWTNSGVTLGRSITVTDPRLVYDAESGRWFASEVDLNIRRQTANRFLVAVSSSSDPTQRWHAVAFAAAGGQNYFADFPTLGVDPNALYLSGDLFNSAQNPAGPVIVAIPKTSLLAATPSNTGMFTSGLLSYDTYGDIVQPAMVTGAASSVMLAVENVGDDFQPHSRLILTPVKASGGTISLGTPVPITVPSYDIPINPTQPGNIDSLDDGDARISASIRRVGDMLYATHCIQSGSRAAVRWYRIDAVQHTLIDSGTITDPELEFFYPSIAANTNGTVVIGCNGTSPNTYVSSYAFIGGVTNNVLTFSGPMLLKAGLATYDTHDSSGTSRWGDYSATTLDPVNPTHFWTIQSFPTDPTTWATQITELVVDGGAGGTTSTNTLPAVNIAQQGSSLVITWPASSGATLQFTPSLNSPNWQNVTATPTTASGETTQIIVPLSQDGFYRLVKS
jgi:hypothetical protein